MSSLPSLNGEGWLDDPEPLADHLLALYFSTDAGESMSFHNKLTSIHYTLSMTMSDRFKLKEAIRNDLERVFNNYFDLTQVDVTIVNTDPSKYELVISVKFNKEGYTYSKGRRITAANSKIKKVVDINNEE